MPDSAPDPKAEPVTESEVAQFQADKASLVASTSKRLRKNQPEFDEQGELVVQPTIVQKQAMVMSTQYRFIQFRNRPMVLVPDPYEHFVPLNKERFDRMAYNLLGGQTRSRMSDIMAYATNAATDLTEYDHLVAFGNPITRLEKGIEQPRKGYKQRDVVWDTRNLMVVGEDYSDCVWRSPFDRIVVTDKTLDPRIPFILSLAGGDIGVYDDIMQSIAPIIMEKKPDGVVWWVGDGANGKSTLMDAIYRIFPGQLSSITVKRLVDGRDIPGLNGTLANVVKESSEGRIDDTEIYKSLGTHESFPVHKFHSQESITINGNIHHIFSGNQVPVFNDKGFSARRRTFIIPFGQRFESDPTFEEKTFTPEFFGRLVDEMQRYAVRLKQQGYRYKFSARTLAAKAEYDTEANNAEEYATAAIIEGMVAFDSFADVRIDYENWCRENGYVALGVGHMRRAILALGFERLTYNVPDGGTTKHYRLPTFPVKDLVPIGGMRMGIWTVSGFEMPEEVPRTIPEIPVDDEKDAKAGGW